MAVISRKRGYLFIMAPRTGCTALATVLIPHMDGEYLPQNDLNDENGRLIVQRKHSTLDELTGYGVLPAEEARALFKFCTIRNPFDSLVSLYAKMVGSYVPLLDDPGSFIHQYPKMVEDMRFVAEHSFSEWIVFRYGHMTEGEHLYRSFIKGMDGIMRFERLQEDLERMVDRLGLPNGYVIPSLNVTLGREPDYRSYYTDESRRVVEAAFRPDLDKFEYSF